MGLIGCRSCIEPSCSGCNLYELEKALTKGYFDAMKVEGGLHICGEVAEVVRCKDCAYFAEAKVNQNGFLICPASGMDITEMDYCSYGERKAGNHG